MTGTPLPDIPIRTVTLFTPPVQAGADGTATIPIDIPDFNGQVRLMVVAWQGSRIGARLGERDRSRSADRRGVAAAVPRTRR